VHGRLARRPGSRGAHRPFRSRAPVRPLARRPIPDLRIVLVAAAHASFRCAARARSAPAGAPWRGATRSQRRVDRPTGPRGKRAPLVGRPGRSGCPSRARGDGRRRRRRADRFRHARASLAMARDHRAPIRTRRGTGDDLGGHRGNPGAFARAHPANRGEGDGAIARPPRGSLGAVSDARALAPRNDDRRGQVAADVQRCPTHVEEPVDPQDDADPLGRNADHAEYQRDDR